MGSGSAEGVMGRRHIGGKAVRGRTALQSAAREMVPPSNGISGIVSAAGLWSAARPRAALSGGNLA